MCTRAFSIPSAIRSDLVLTMLTVALIAIVWAGLAIFCKLRFRFADKMPAVEPLVPFFGNGLEFAGKNSYEIWQSLTRAFKDNKRIFKLCFGPIAVVCPTHPDLVQKVLCDTASMNKPHVYSFMRVDLGLLSATCMCRSEC